MQRKRYTSEERVQVFVGRYIKSLAVDDISNSILLAIIDFLTQRAFLTSGQRWLFIYNYARNSLLLRLADKHSLLIVKLKSHTVQHTPDFANDISTAYISLIARECHIIAVSSIRYVVCAAQMS